MSKIIKKFQILNELEEEILSEIKFLYVFKDFKNNVLIVTNDDKVFAFGDNKWGVLGFGNKTEVNKLTTNEELSYKQIIDFKNSEYHVIARTIDGKVYCWGYNRDGVLGNGENDSNYYGPQLNEYLSDKQITHICCGAYYTLVLTNSGEVYAWGDNKRGQIGNGRSGENEFQLTPIKVNGFNEEKVVMISCGGWHSMALTERGQVLSWGSNNSGQLGHNNNEEYISKPTIVSLNNKISIKKISCGLRHSLLLSCDENIYWFGNNGCETQKTPKKLTINTNKFIDIASHYFYDISIALSVNGICYVWGKFGNQTLKVPKETESKSFDDIFNLYFGITYKTLNLCNKELNKKENILKTQVRLEENGHKVIANKTEYNLGSAVNRFSSQSSETLSRYKSDFEELELIGSGYFGKVYKVLNCLDQQQYAVKTIFLRGIYKSNFHHL
jgi:alpha-tubulin suppressor-like RCC1 family protein